MATVTPILKQNYPNPFNPETTIHFALPKSSRVQVKIHNHLGQLVRTLVDRDLPAGNQTISWDGRNEPGQLVAGGIYFYALQVDEQTRAIRRIVFLK